MYICPCGVRVQAKMGNADVSWLASCLDVPACIRCWDVGVELGVPVCIRGRGAMSSASARARAIAIAMTM